MSKERNKADDYREKAYAGDTKAMNRSTSGRLLPTGRKNLGVCYERGSLCPLAYAAPPFDGGAQRDERKGLKWIHKSTFQGYQPAIDYCKEHHLKWY